MSTIIQRYTTNYGPQIVVLLGLRFVSKVRRIETGEVQVPPIAAVAATLVGPILIALESMVAAKVRSEPLILATAITSGLIGRSMTVLQMKVNRTPTPPLLHTVVTTALLAGGSALGFGGDESVSYTIAGIAAATSYLTFKLF